MPDPAPLRPTDYYHIYNRGNNREDIFREPRNYRYFLRLYVRHVVPVCDTFVYCLLRNHFHLLVRIKDDDRANRAGQCFSNLFNAYARAYNRAYGRTGALFQRPFGRIQVASQEHLVWLVIYIHQNPERHGLVDDFRKWPNSSYDALAINRETFLAREETLAWFDGLEGFRIAHEDRSDAASMVLLTGEDS